MPGPKRRALLSLGLLLRPFATLAASGPSRGPAFTARAGVNVVALGFDIYKPVSVQSWDEAAPDARLVSLRAAGFDHIRVAFDPTPALAATTSAATDGVLAIAAHALDATRRCGLKAILDLHVGTQGPWSTAAIEADYPAGPTWRRYLDVACRVAKLCAGYPASAVALELYNENSNNESYGNSAWAVRVQALWAALRAVNQATTLLVGGSFYSSIEGLQDLRAGSFDANTGFVVHNYNPTIFTHQNAAGYTRYVQRLHYPPIASQRAAAMQGTADRIEASELPPTEKQRARIDRSRRLAAYFDAPQGPDYVIARVAEIAAWQKRNDVPGSRIFITEYGSHNDHDLPGADLLARFAWAQDVDRAHEARGYCRTVWNYNSPDYWDITQEDGSWRIRDGFLLALGEVPASPFEGEAEALWSAGPSPGAADKALVSHTIRQLKDHGLWDKIETLWVFAKPPGIAANWKTTGPEPSAFAHLAHTHGLGAANQPGEAATVPTGVSLADRGHAGVLVAGPAAGRSMAVGWGAFNRLLQISPAGVVSGPTTAAAKGDQGMLHALIGSGPDVGNTLYVNGSQAGSGASLPPASRPPEFSFEAGNQAKCAVFHAGRPLTPDEVTALFTILRFHANGAARNAGAA